MKVIIVGAGIGGSVLALALQRAGIELELFETRAAATAGGSWLNFQANGIDALRAIDAAAPIEDAGYEVDTISFFNGRGRHLGGLPMAARRLDGLTSRMLSRATLSRGLYGILGDRSLSIHQSKRFIGAHYDGDRVIALFDDGSQACGDLLVGADGIWSIVRTLINPNAARPRYVPVLNIGGLIPGFNVDVPPKELRMQFGRWCFFGWMSTPDGGTVWFANPPRPKEPARGELATITDQTWRSELHALIGTDAGPAHAIIDHSPRPLEAWATYDLPSVKRWHDGRGITLLGDAAHAVAPSSGQGASMAIEDAVQLARCLRDLPTIPAALAAYEHLRRARTERIVAHGRRSANVKAAGSIGRVVRDAVLPFLFGRASHDEGASMMWLQGHHIEFDQLVTAA